MAQPSGMEIRHRAGVFKPFGDEELEKPKTRLLRAMANADLFPKPKEDFRRVPSEYSSLISWAGLVLIGLLVLNDLVGYLSGRGAYHTHLQVDEGITGGVPFNFDITFHAINCNDLHLDVMDAAGSQDAHVAHDLFKSPVDRHGQVLSHGHFNYVEKKLEAFDIMAVLEHNKRFDPKSNDFCGQCYFPPATADTPGSVDAKLKDHLKDAHKGQCCNTCESVLKSYDEHSVPRPHVYEIEQCIYELSLVNPGCNIKGTLFLKKVKGNFHFAPGMITALNGGTHLHQFSLDQLLRYNISHTVNHMSVGDASIARFSKNGVHFPLDGVSYTPKKGLATCKYFIKIVPATYVTRSSWDRELDDASVVPSQSYEFSVQHAGAEIEITGFLMTKIPSIFFVFDFHPIQINNVFQRPPVTRFLVKLCGIVGGVFVVLGIVDRAVGFYFSRRDESPSMKSAAVAPRQEVMKM